MDEIDFGNLSDDDTDIYTNCVAHLKALKQKNQLKTQQSTISITLDALDSSLEDATSICKTLTDNNSKQNHGPKRRNPRRGNKKVQEDFPPPKANRVPQIEEDPIVIDDTEELVVIEDEDKDNYEVDVKVLWRSQTVHRISLLRNDSFQKVFQYFEKLENVSAKQILLMRKDVMINPTDSPASLNLTVIDILEGGIVSADVIARNNCTVEEEQTQDDTCEIKVQVSNKKSISIPLKKGEPFSKLIAECARQLNVKESTVKLYFDGEQIVESDTPESLEFEEEACIDLRIASK